MGRPEAVEVRQAYGRVLAREVRAPEDLPKRDSSQFDGFAVKADDTASACASSPTELELVPGVERLGLVPGPLGPGRAMRVLTGGFLPEGADAVLAVEEARVDGGRLTVSSPIRLGEHVFRAGSDVRRGESVIPAGKTLGGQDLVLLASLRFRRVAVARRPRVAIIPTGTELTAEIADRRTGKTFESHSLLLERLVAGAGGTAETLPIVPDDERRLVRAIDRALGGHDIVFTLAGSSVGESDLVDTALSSFGRATSLLVHGVKVNRGRVMGVAVVRRKPVLIVPGPIQGALNAFIVFGYPMIRRHLGLGLEEPPWVDATVTEDWEATGRFKHFEQVVYLRLERDEASKTLLASPGSADTEKVSFLVSKTAYALLPGDEPRLSRGERVAAHLLPGFSYP